MMTKKNRKLWLTAYHEAGHAVVLYRTAGHVGGHVSIVRRTKEGRVQMGCALDGVSDSFNSEHMEATILSCYAGGHAQRSLEPTCGAEGCEEDDAQAEEQLRLLGWEHREQELRERSLALTRKHWAEIVAVADELLRLRVLDDVEVEALSDAAAGDSDAIRDLALCRAARGQELQEWRKRAQRQ